MDVNTLIAHLSYLRKHGLPGTAMVRAYDADSERWEEVTGSVYDTQTIELQTDDKD